MTIIAWPFIFTNSAKPSYEVPIVRDQVESKSTHKSWTKSDAKTLVDYRLFFLFCTVSFWTRREETFGEIIRETFFFAFSPEANSLWPLRCERSDALSAKFKANLVMSKIAYFFQFCPCQKLPFCWDTVYQIHRKVTFENNCEK